MKEIMKKHLNYKLYIPWNRLDIIFSNSDNTFLLKQKIEMPRPPSNTPAPNEAMIDDNEMQDDCSSETSHAAHPEHNIDQTSSHADACIVHDPTQI
ncbi:2813_t:CDS:1, partial [Acaulospora morrowiae]